MNNAWTQEQTKESVRRQKKALLIVTPIVVILFIGLFFAFGYIVLHWFMEPPEYHLQIEHLIERGYLSKDYTTIEYLDFCENIEQALYDKYDYVCRWID